MLQQSSVIRGSAAFTPPPTALEDRILGRTADDYYPFRSTLALAQSLRIGFTATKGRRLISLLLVTG